MVRLRGGWFRGGSHSEVHILYLIPGLGRSGGAEQAIAVFAAPYAERGVQLDVVTFTGRDALRPTVEQAGGTVIDLGAGSMVALTARVRSLVRERQPDLVHTTLFEADLAGRVGARWAGVPVVSSLVNVAYGPEQRANPALRAWKLEAARRADRLTARLPRRFHALTGHVAAVMGDRLAIDPDRIDVIPRGRDAATLGSVTPSRQAAARRSLGVDGDEPLVLALARHEFQKGLDVLVRAWPDVRSEVPNAVLRLGGRAGSQSALIEHLVADLGPDSGVLEVGVRDDVPDLLSAADSFVVPSRWEGLGSILIEAMALGAPVVTTEVGPIPEVTGLGWARLVPPDDPAALARAVVATLRQPVEERQRRADVARARVGATFTLATVADDMVAFYQRALA